MVTGLKSMVRGRPEFSLGAHVLSRTHDKIQDVLASLIHFSGALNDYFRSNPEALPPDG